VNIGDGALASTAALTGRPLVVVFEYSDEAKKEGWNYRP
jgi:hypothetical protein